MFKKLIGVLVLAVFAVFILPMEFRACDFPECGKINNTDENRIISVYCHDCFPTRPHREVGMYVDDVSRVLIDYLLENREFEYGTIIELVAVVDGSYFVQQYGDIQREVGMYVDDVSRALIDYLLENREFEYGTIIKIVAVDEPYFVPQYGDIQPLFGCCLHQSIETGFRTIQIWVPLPGGLSFCDRYEDYELLFCRSCGYTSEASIRLVNVRPGCRMVIFG